MPVVPTPAPQGKPILPQQARSRPARLHYLDGLRAVAALFVVLTHTYQTVFWDHKPKGLLLHLDSWLLLGRTFVVLFIVLSGFCLMLPVLSYGGLRGGVRGFYAARARRILPAYYAALAFALVMIAVLIGNPHNTIFDLCLPVSMKSILAHLLLIHNLWPPPYYFAEGNTKINIVFWSIALEWQIYFWFPLLVFAWRRRWIFVVGPAACALNWAVMSFTGQWHYGGLDWAGLNANYYGYFVLGVMAAVIAVERPDLVRRVPWILIAGLLTIPFALYYEFRYGIYYDFPMADSYTALIFATLILGASREGAAQRVLSWHPLVRVGEYSYSIYLLHLPIITALAEYLILPLRGRIGDGKDFLLLLAVCLPTVLFVAYHFSLIFENKRVIAQALERVGIKAVPVPPHGPPL